MFENARKSREQFKDQKKIMSFISILVWMRIGRKLKTMFPVSDNIV